MSSFWSKPNNCKKSIAMDFKPFNAYIVDACRTTILLFSLAPCDVTGSHWYYRKCHKCNAIFECVAICFCSSACFWDAGNKPLNSPYCTVTMFSSFQCHDCGWEEKRETIRRNWVDGFELAILESSWTLRGVGDAVFQRCLHNMSSDHFPTNFAQNGCND